MSRNKKKSRLRKLLAAKKQLHSSRPRKEPSLMAEAIRRAYSGAGKEQPTKSESPEQARASAKVPPAQITSTNANPRVVRSQVGIATQVSASVGADVVDLVIGLDLGTSCTKVLIQDVARRIAYAVPFDDQDGMNFQYLLPTTVYLDEIGEFNIAGRGKRINRLKQNLMSIAAKDPKERSEHKKSLLPHTIAYLSLVMRAARQWFFDAHGGDYRGRRISWRINVGLPASRFDEPAMPKLYRSTVRRAWYLSTFDAPISLSLADRIWKEAQLPTDSDVVLKPDEIGAFPEVVAAVQGYARSPERQEGLHLLVDVGASTMDVTCFRLMQHEYEDRYPIFFATISPLGGFKLFRYRADKVITAVEAAIEMLEQKLNGIAEPQSPLAIRFALDEKDRDEINADFGNRVGESIWKVIAETKSRRDPSAREWKGRLPTFLCGGASQIDLYEQALRRIDKNKSWAGRLEIKDLILPRVVDAPGLPLGLRHRLLVAFGLSFSALDIGELIPPGGIPDPEDAGPRKQYTDDFVGAEMV